MMKRRSARLALALLACVVVAGCAGSGNTSADDGHRGFYGGVSGGMTRLP
jgi:ABC-type glycerol-3-phosphate transport system substrate-binding protein